MPGAATRKTTARRSVDVFVEIPKGSLAKYEPDKATGQIRLDRVPFSSVHHPADYGFVWIRELKDLAPHWLREIEVFSSRYETLEGGPVELAGWRGSRTAWSLIQRRRLRT